VVEAIGAPDNVFEMKSIEGVVRAVRGPLG
jgi:hypothetical protein